MANKLKVLIVSINRCRVPFAVMPFGACMIAEAASSAGHEVRMLDLMFERSPNAKPRSFEFAKKYISGIPPAGAGGSFG